LTSYSAHERAVEVLATALKTHRNWYLDLANERDVRDARYVSAEELKKLREQVRRLDPQRLVTASFGGHDLDEGNLRESLLTAGVDFLSPHRPRNAKSPGETQSHTRSCVALMKEIGRTVPVHYQEPFRRGYGKWEPMAADFLTDLRGALDGGAAGWCFHNGSQRAAEGNRPQRSFDLREKRLFDQLDDEERKVVRDASFELRRTRVSTGKDERPAVSPAEVRKYEDRFVWVFGWNLSRDRDVADISQVLETASQHQLNGAVMSVGLDTLCKKSPDYFRRLDEVQQQCARNKLELIPSVFSVGYGGAALAHDRNLAEGLPVEDATFAVKNGAARLVPDDSARLANGGFEEFSGNVLRGYRFHDQPGVVSFVDKQVKHGGEASLRLESFAANPHGHGRVMQEVRVRPRRCYRLSMWVKSQDLQPDDAFKVQVLAGTRALAPREFNLPSSGDWRKVSVLFNSLDFDSVRLYAGTWGGKAGRLWLDDWTLEEVGPLNVLRRPGTPVTVRSEDGTDVYAEGRDFAPLEDSQYSTSRLDREAPSLALLPGSRIREGQRLRVSWYHAMAINASQVTVCMAEPKLYEIFDHEAELLAKRLRPRKVFLNMDEIRMGGTCAACRGRDMAELLGQCITRQVKILRRHMPGVEVYIWSDMLDPHHNAHGDYYLVRGDFTGSWKHVPKDLVIAVWGGAPRESSLRHFAGKGFRTLIACYYDANSLDEVKAWLGAASPFPKVRGLMYTPWQKKYALLGDFGDLLQP
jgi:hypothetical protein